MRRHAKASTAGSTQRQASGLGRFFRGAFATRGTSLDAKGSGAPAARRLAIPVTVFAAIVAAIALIAIPASAKTHLLKETFGSAAQPSFGEARGIAIDQSSGDVLVMDAGGTPSIERYKPDGTADDFSALGTNVIDGQGSGDLTPENGLGFSSPSESQIAVDNSGGATDGNIYVTQSFPNLINIFSSTGAYLGQLTESSGGAFNEACGVAVDPSGAVYVGDYSSGIHKFVPAANPPVNADNTANFSTVSQPCTLAAGAGATAGFLFPATYNGAISKIDSGTGELKYVASADSNTTVSVDPASGHVYGAAGSAIEEFDASGAGSATTVSNVKLAGQARGVAVRGSSGDIYVAHSGNSKLEIFSSALVSFPGVTTNAATGNTGTKATLNGAVDPDGIELTECKFEYGKAVLPLAYNQTVPCAETPAAIGAGTSPVPVHADISGLAPNGTQYDFSLVAKNPSVTVNGSNQSFDTADTVIATAATGVTSTAATLNGSVNPDGVAIIACEFEYGTSTAYGQTAACVPNAAGIGSGTSPVAVAASLSGLTPGTAYHFRLKAANANGPILAKDETLQTLGPAIETTWAQDVTRTEVTLKAKIDPEGQATTFHFEWGTTTAYGSSSPEISLGSDSSVHTVSAFPAGLTPGTVYHYRVVATNAGGVNEGPDQTIRTFETLALDTSCPNQALRAGPSASLPDCRAYEMVSPVDKAGTDIVPETLAPTLDTSSDQAALDGDKMAYTAYKPFGDALSNLWSNHFIASRGANGWSTHSINPPHVSSVYPFVAFAYQPGRYSAFTEDLSTGFLYDDADPPLTPDALTGYYNFYLRNNLTETYKALTTQLFSPGPAPAFGGGMGMGFMGYSRDASHTLFAADVALTPDAIPAAPGNLTQLYDYHDGELELVSVLPNDEPAGESAAGAANVLVYSYEDGGTEHAISDDGSRIFWTTNYEASTNGYQNSGDIYARIDGERTVPVSGSVAATNNATYQNASTDGSKVIFTVGEKLYKFDVDTETPTLIAGEVEPHKGVLGTSDDASYVYFLSREVLAPGATTGEPNLYLDHEGTKSFIATLARQEEKGASFEGPPAFYGTANNLVVTADFSHVTPDGNHVVFQSLASLTGYDNTSVTNGSPAVEIYDYEADAQQLSCISCNPSGGRPETQFLQWPHYDRGLGVQAAAWLPTPRRATYVPRMVADDGSYIFFNSYDALVPQDTNGAQDVYEWEEEGVGGCQKSGGCVSLISTGENPEDSTFMDASAGGYDVFFRTSAGIDPADPGLIDIYDARVGGGFAPPSEPQPCVGDACQSVPEPPNDPTPASASFNGAGDPAAGKPRRSCRARSRHATKQSGKAKHKKAKRCKRNNRRAGR